MSILLFSDQINSSLIWWIKCCKFEGICVCSRLTKSISYTTKKGRTFYIISIVCPIFYLLSEHWSYCRLVVEACCLHAQLVKIGSLQFGFSCSWSMYVLFIEWRLRINESKKRNTSLLVHWNVKKFNPFPLCFHFFVRYQWNFTIGFYGSNKWMTLG